MGHAALKKDDDSLVVRPGILSCNANGRLLDPAEKLAVSILVMAMARADKILHEEEEKAVRGCLSSAMSISMTELQDYLASSEALLQEKHILRHASWIVNDDFSSAQRAAICKILDIVAAADGPITKAEKRLESFLRKLLETPSPAAA